MSFQAVLVMVLFMATTLVLGDTQNEALFGEEPDFASDQVGQQFLETDGFYPELLALLEEKEPDYDVVEQRAARYGNSFILKRELENLISSIEEDATSPNEPREEGEIDEETAEVDKRGMMMMPSIVKRFGGPSILKRFNVPSVIKRYSNPTIIRRLKVPSIIKRSPSHRNKKMIMPAVIKKSFGFNPAIIKRYADDTNNHDDVEGTQDEGVKEKVDGYYSVQ